MITLCMDTSHIFLTLVLIKDDTILAQVSNQCWKRQSEEIFPSLMSMMDGVHLQPEDIDAIVITEGPGSYTGVRIAMTIAKVFCSMKDIPLYTIGTLQLFAGKEHCRVILDARGKRVYTAVVNQGKYEEEPHVMNLEDLNTQESSLPIVGDSHLVGLSDYYPDFGESFLFLKSLWNKAENVDLVTPEYLKSSSSYLVQ